MEVKVEKEKRESIEWTNTWWSEANTDNRRGLLIGDSTTRQLRSSMEALLTNLYAVDLFAASFSIHDRRLDDYIDIFFKGDEYKYDFAVLHYGGHHGFSRLCSESREEYLAYEEKYRKLLKRLKEKCKKVVCVTGTSEVLETDVNTIDQKTEREIIVRNQIVSNVACENGVAMFDLYKLMKSNKGLYTYYDRFHFNRDSDYFISCNLLEFVLSKNVISKELVKQQRMYFESVLMDLAGLNKEYMIYGAGAIGVKLYWVMRWYGMEDAIRCFVETHRKVKETISQKPVVLISELNINERENCTLIISSDRYSQEMYQMAFDMKIRNVIFYRDIINRAFTKCNDVSGEGVNG